VIFGSLVGPKATANAPNTHRFITDSAGNTIDLDYTKGLRETNVTVTGTRGGVQYALQGLGRSRSLGHEFALGQHLLMQFSAMGTAVS